MQGRGAGGRAELGVEQVKQRQTFIELVYLNGVLSRYHSMNRKHCQRIDTN